MAWRGGSRLWSQKTFALTLKPRAGRLGFAPDHSSHSISSVEGVVGCQSQGKQEG